jgi:cell division septal protein FtsQ
VKFKRRRSSLLPRPQLRRETAGELKQKVWSIARSRPSAPRERLRTVLAMALAAAEVALVGWLLLWPVFIVRTVQISGLHRADRAQVLTDSGLDRPGNVFAVDAATIRRKLVGTAWIKDASVTTQLPDQVQVQVQEWEPLATFHAGPQGRLLLLSERAAVLGPGSSKEGLLDVEGPPGGDPRPGQRALDPLLLTAMINVQHRLPIEINQEVVGYSVDPCGNLTLIARKGWKAYFGRVLTPEEYANLKIKVDSIKSVAVAGEVDFNSPDLEYVNVMNPLGVAVKYRSATAPPPTARPSPSPGATPSGPQLVQPSVPQCR